MEGKSAQLLGVFKMNKIWVYLAVVWTSASVSSVLAQDAKLGRELYQGRCLECHKEAPYGTGVKKAQSLEGVRSMAKLWDSISPGTPWTRRDLDDVVSYLNQEFYHF
jgi:mono/diheme cytochrome c family protein